jgi:hypothetical protein
MKRLFVQQCQNSDGTKVNWWPAGSHLVMQIFAALPGILAPPRWISIVDRGPDL